MISWKQNWLRVALYALSLALPVAALAADRSVKNLSAPKPQYRTVEMFAAMDAKEIEVRLIPKDATESRILIKNNTKQPLNVKLPDTFAGRPVLAQIGGGSRGGSTSSSGGGGGQQSTGGGMGGGGMGGGGMGGGGGGMFSVPPEQLGQFKVPTVCLEHGKKEPRPNIPYEIVPLEKVSTDPALKELLTAFGKNRLDQRSAQAAAWHLANKMSWQELASKRIEHLNGSSEAWFNLQEINAGMQFATAATTLATKVPAKSLADGESFQPVSEN
jgi:hypothetical protein